MASSQAGAPDSTQPPSLQRTPTAGTHTCFICLQTDTETPTLPFVNPCPCTLEAHESCLLTWISETERSNTTNRKPIQCPACHHRIRVEEPHDSIVALQEGLRRGFAKVSPYALLALVIGGGLTGSGWYGLMSMQVFAGPEAAGRWLGLGRAARDGPLWRWAPFWRFTLKTWMLSCIGPGLMVWRAIPQAGNLMLLPLSLASAAALAARDDMPQWPPSPVWTATLLPFVTLTYSNIYYELFGAFERRLNQALRQRPVVDEPEAPRREEGAAAGGDQQAQNQGQMEEHHDEHNHAGLLASIWNLGHAVFGLFRDRDVVLELDGGVRAEVGNGGEGIELQIEVDQDEAEDLLEMLGDAAEVIEEEGEDMPELEDLPGRDQPAAQEDDQQPQDAPAPAPAPAQDNDPAPAAAQENRPIGTLHDIVSSIVLSLLQPAICFGMGEVLRLALPRSLVTPRSWGRAPSGLLQHQWGRSLVGGCVYVVLRDAFKLYAKYRLVQVKGNRKVKNVERKVSP